MKRIIQDTIIGTLQVNDGCFCTPSELGIVLTCNRVWARASEFVLMQPETQHAETVCISSLKCWIKHLVKWP